MSRRLLAALLAAVASWAFPDPAAAAPMLRHQVTVNGDFTLFGNTLAHDCRTSATPTVGTASSGGACGSNRNDTGVDLFWVSDGVNAVADTSNTAAQARSTAVLSIPPGATVEYARIYWAAQNTVNAYDSAAQLTTPDGVTTTLTADRGTVLAVRTPVEYWYQSSADVTGLLQGLVDPRGPYAISGVSSRDIVDLSSETTFDAWWGVVFYRDPADTALRQLTLFDGLDFVDNVAPGNVVDVTLGGFLVPNGGFDAKLGVVAYEGDDAVDGDRLFFQGYRSVDPEPTALTTLSDAMSPENDFFNGTRSWLGAARTVAGDLPQMSGAAASMMSFDFDVVNLKDLGAIGAGHDSAKIRATSTQDVYALGAFITSINTLKPSFIQTVKTGVNLTRAGAILAGDVIEYTIDTQNTGNDPSIQTLTQDALPAGVTYLAGTLEIVAGANAGSKSDGAGDDQGEYDSATRTITVRLGTGATAFVGGSMAIGETAQIRFRVTVDAGAAGMLQNQASVTAGGLSGEPPRAFPSTPPGGAPGPTPLPIDACLDDTLCGGATRACLTTSTPNVCVACTSDAYCGGAAPRCDLAAHACVGLTTVAPGAQDRTTVAGVAAPFPMTLTSNGVAAEVYDLDVADPGCGWGIELRGPGAALLGTRDGAGAWTIAPGGDTNSDGRPDAGATAGGGGTSTFTSWMTPPGGLPYGSSCTATLTAYGASSGLTASATATLRTAAAATFTPSATGTSAKAVARGGDVGFPGLIQNNTSAPLDFDVSAVVTTTPDAGPLQPYVFFSDPNGDGDPADGAQITTTGAVAPYGGTVRVVLVLRAVTSTGVPVATGTILDATAIATAGAVVATQASEARVQFAATYGDAARTLVQNRFAPCDTVHLGANLLPSGFPYELEWYAMANPVRGTDTPRRTVDPWPVSGGMGSDSLVVPAEAGGTWTVLVVAKTTPDLTIVDTITFVVDRAGEFVSLNVPARIAMTDGLSVSASVRNQNVGSAYSGSQLAYSVTDGASFMDGTGAFGGTPATAHLTSSLDVAAGATAADAWWIAAPAWPAPGVYQVNAAWQLQCGATPAIALATSTVQVVPPAPAITSPAAGAVVGPRPIVSGTGIAGAAVTVSAGGESCGPVTVSGGGAWSCTFGTPLASGATSATSVQTVSGATSDPSAAVGFTVDGSAPAVAIGTPAGGALLGGGDAPGRAVAFSGTAEVGTSVQIESGGKSGAASLTGASWSATLTLDADGVYTAIATATDAVGNAATAEISYTLDTIPPPVPVIGFPASGASLDAGSVPGGFLTVTGTADPDAIVTVTVAGVSTAGSWSGASWSATFSPGEGEWTATATAMDAARNVSAAASSTFDIDTEPPAAPTFTFPLDGAALSAVEAPDGALTLAGATDPSTAVTVTVDGTAYAATVVAGGWSLPLTLVNGSHAASAVAADAAGNTAGPVTIVFSVDATAPAAPTLDAVASPTRVDPVPVSGSAEAGSTVELFLDAVSVGTTTAAPSGTFAFSLAGVAPDSHTVRAIATDAVGNASPQSAARTFVVDRLAPGLATVDLLEGAVLDAAAAPGGVVPLSGTSELGSSVEVELDGAFLGTIVSAPGGTWTAGVALLDGQHQVRVRATDAAGNVGAWSGSTLFTLDANAPVAPVLDAPTSPTSALSIQVTGTAEAGATIAVYVDAVLAGTTTAAGGAFSLPVPVAEGSRSFTAVATDSVGNVSPLSAAVSAVVDRSSPAPVLAALVSPTSATTVTVSGTAEAGATVTVYVDGVSAGTTTAAGDGSFSLPVGVAEGSRAFTASAVDALGNASQLSAAVTTVVDRSSPAPVLAALASPTSATTITVSGTAEAAATVTVYVDGVSAGTTTAAGDGTFSLIVSVAEGARSVTASAVDALGNASATSVAASVVVDWTAPAPPSLAALASPTSATTVTVAGTAEPGATVAILVDGSVVTTLVAAGDGTFSVSVVLGEGSHAVTATASDVAGTSVESSSRTVVVDLTAPAAPSVTAPASGSVVIAGAVIVSGTAEPGATVSVTVNGTVATDVAASDGTFSIPVTLPAGDWSASVTATDPAGNTSPTATRSFTSTPAASRSDPGAGGCGCKAGDASPAALLLLPLALLLAPRRRRTTVLVRR
jgi:uncharacterized repeat protein (TIGR01451 family)